MIRASIVWSDGHVLDRNHEWQDEDWHWVQHTWQQWVDRRMINEGVIWLTAAGSISDHVVLDHCGEGYLFGEKL
jgi:hypothetical protein